MGDADLTRRGDPIVQPQQMAGVLDALDDDLTNLHATVHELENRTLEALSVHVKGYTDFRRFLLALNFIILPILVAVGICYSLKEMSISEPTEELFRVIIMFLLYVIANLGIPLYIGTLWAIYQFSLPVDIDDADFLNLLMTGEFNTDPEFLLADMNQSNERGANESAPETENDNAAIIPNIQAQLQSELNSLDRQTSRHSTSSIEAQVQEENIDGETTAPVTAEVDRKTSHQISPMTFNGVIESVNDV